MQKSLLSQIVLNPFWDPLVLHCYLGTSFTSDLGLPRDLIRQILQNVKKKTGIKNKESVEVRSGYRGGAPPISGAAGHRRASKEPLRGRGCPELICFRSARG